MIIRSSKHTLTGSPRHQFDLFFNATGFEQRASSLVRFECVSATQFVSLLFVEHRVLGFAENLRVMGTVSTMLVDDYNKCFRGEFVELVKDMTSRLGKRIRVGIDVSSMNRTMAATTISSIFAHRTSVESLELFYVTSKFDKPTLSFTPIQQIGPVTPELSGFDSEPALPVALVLGLGFEYGPAVGIINQLEPQITLCFRAIGHDPRFEDEVRRANLDFDFGTYNVAVSEYELLDLQSAYLHIENIVHSLTQEFRVVMVPMGPKILSALMVLIALKYFGRVSVWRVARPIDRPTSVFPDAVYVAATVDLHASSVGANFDQLEMMLNGHFNF
jgi:hypothetical protein